MGNRERILAFALSEFNRHGFSQVSTLAITTELAISPGNLYYHFANKDEIALALLQEFERALHRIRSEFSLLVKRPEDYWPFLHSLLTLLDHYRFLLRDMNGAAITQPAIRRPLLALFANLRQLSRDAMSKLHELGTLPLAADSRDLLAENTLLVAVGWINLQSLAQSRPLDHTTIRLGVRQLIALVSPHLT